MMFSLGVLPLALVSGGRMAIGTGVFAAQSLQPFWASVCSSFVAVIQKMIQNR
jgi:hypothetical protein